MADFAFLMGCAVKAQTTRGTATTMETIGNGAAIDNVNDGAVLGSAAAGEGETGISVTFGKNIQEKAFQTGSFTRDFGDFIGRTLESLQITVPMKGNGATASGTPADSEFVLDPGIDALFECGGLTAANWGSGVGQEYTPANTTLATIAIYIGGGPATQGTRVVLRDCEASAVSFDFTPGTVGTVTFDLTGVIDAVDQGTWDATPFDYGNQSTLSALPVQDAAFTWLARTIGFTALSIAIDNQSESVPSSNATGGNVARQTGRDIRITTTIDATDVDTDFELTQLAASTIASASALYFDIGTAATAAGTINSYALNFDDPELISAKPVPIGNSQGYECELIARSATANGEMSLIYL